MLNAVRLQEVKVLDRRPVCAGDAPSDALSDVRLNLERAQTNDIDSNFSCTCGRALLLNEEGTLAVSGSSDHTLRLWDLGQQRCLQAFAVHTDSVWALAAAPDLSLVYSGGRDRCVYRCASSAISSSSFGAGSTVEHCKVAH